MSAFLRFILADSSLSFNKERDHFKKTGGELENVGFVVNLFFKFSTMPMFFKRGMFSWSGSDFLCPLLYPERRKSAAFRQRLNVCVILYFSFRVRPSPAVPVPVPWLS